MKWPKTLEVQTINHQNFNFICIPITGDQVIFARICGAQLARCSSENRCDRLEGVLPFIEDWRTRQLSVCNGEFCNYIM